MKRKVILIVCVLVLNNCTWAQTSNLNESIIQSIRNSMLNISIGSYAFCMPEFLFVIEQDSLLFAKFCDNLLGRMAYLEPSKDVYLTELLKIQFLKDSLHVYSNDKDEEIVIKKLMDFLGRIPEYKLQKNDCYLFFESFTEESGVGAIKIETLLITQDLDLVFDYIENNEQAKKRFLYWIEDEIEVWTPSFATGINNNWDNRIVNYLYNRLYGHNHILSQQAANKMKSWFEL